MNTEVSPAASSEAITLPPDLGIETITDLSDLLAPRLRVDAPVVLDAHLVSRVHTAALQLLCMFCVGRRKAGLSTRWLEPSESLKQAVTTLSLDPLLQIADSV